MKKFNLLIIGLLVLFFQTLLVAQVVERKQLDVPKVDPAAITIDGSADEAEWETAAEAGLVTNAGYEIWANKYEREDIPEPEFDELYAKMLWAKETLYVYVRWDEFVNDTTDLFWDGKWVSDQLFVSLSAQLGVEMMGWYDGNSYLAPEGPYHFWILGDEVTLNGGDTTYVPEEYRDCPGDSLMTYDVSEFVRYATNIDEETGLWEIEMAIYNPHVNGQSAIGFNIGGSVSSSHTYGLVGDAYGYFTWQPSLVNDPWGNPGVEADPGYYNLASSSHWALLHFTPGEEDYVREFLEVPYVLPGTINIDGQMDVAWETAAEAGLVTNAGYNIWANKYEREDIPEPEFDELLGKMLWTDDTLLVYVNWDEFVNDTTDLFWDGKWVSDQLFISISNQLGVEMMGWYDGNSYLAPEGPFHFWGLGEEITLNGGDTTYVPEEYRGCPGDSNMVFMTSDYGRYATTIDKETGKWTVEMAVYCPNAANKGRIGFNLGGSMSSEHTYNLVGDAYGYFTWQPSLDNDPWGNPGVEADPGFYNLASSSHWAILEFNGKIVGVDDDENPAQIPSNFALDQNYPNPFNPTTNISFRLAEKSPVTLRVYNILGETVTTLVDNKDFIAGKHEVTFNGAGLSSGVYFYELRVNNFVQTKKMVLIK